MRRYILSLIAGTALACGATTANAAITIGTTGSSAGSTLTWVPLITPACRKHSPFTHLSVFEYRSRLSGTELFQLHE